MFAPIIKLHNWIYKNKFIYDENSMEFLKKNNDIRINWSYVVLNVNSIDKLKENSERINWCHLATNPSSIHFLKKEKEKKEEKETLDTNIK